MPQDLYEKRIDAYKKFTPTVKKLFARAVQVEEYEDGETIIRKCYNVEMKRKSDGNIAPMDIMDIANAQAGFETLPPPVQDMVVESVAVQDSHVDIGRTVGVEPLLVVVELSVLPPPCACFAACCSGHLPVSSWLASMQPCCC